MATATTKTICLPRPSFIEARKFSLKTKTKTGLNSPLFCPHISGTGGIISLTVFTPPLHKFPEPWNLLKMLHILLPSVKKKNNQRNLGWDVLSLTISNSLVFFLLIQWRFIKNIASFLKEAFARSCERILKKVMFKLVVGKWIHNSNTSKNMIRSSVNKFWSQSLRPGLWKTAVPLCASSDLHL